MAQKIKNRLIMDQVLATSEHPCLNVDTRCKKIDIIIIGIKSIDPDSLFPHNRKIQVRYQLVR